MEKKTRSERPPSETRYEVKLTPDGKRLLLVVWLAEGSNFWVHDNGTFSWVPLEIDFKTMDLGFKAINDFNGSVSGKDFKPQS